MAQTTVHSPAGPIFAAFPNPGKERRFCFSGALVGVLP